MVTVDGNECLFIVWFSDALAIRLGVEIAGHTIPVQIIEAMPYLLTVFLLAGLLVKRWHQSLRYCVYVKERNKYFRYF